MTAARAAWREHYAQLQACLAQPGWISEGYVQDRGPGAGGPCYQWTRKVKGKTVSVALSKEQYEWLAAAIANWRTVQASLKSLQRLSTRSALRHRPRHPATQTPLQEDPRYYLSAIRPMAPVREPGSPTPSYSSAIGTRHRRFHRRTE